jgi:hypothetical protein
MAHGVGQPDSRDSVRIFTQLVLWRETFYIDREEPDRPMCGAGKSGAFPFPSCAWALSSQDTFPIMKKIAIVAVLILFILLLTKIAQQVPPEPPPGTAFSLKAQQVVQCSSEDITLVDKHQKATHLERDDSWPECSVFQKDDVLDFYLSRGAKTKYLSREKTEWWRKAM